MKRLILILSVALAMAAHAEVRLYSPSGQYLGNLNNNQFDPNSVSNPYGRYGSKYSPDSINNQFGEHGSRFGSDSVNNPFGSTNGAPTIKGPFDN